MTDRDRRLAEIFREAVAVPPAARAKVLEARCQGDRSLRDEVAALLTQDDEGSELPLPARTEIEELRDEIQVPLPDRIGEYSVEEELGRGGMGVVYLAEDPRLRRQVALKVLPPDRAGDPAARSRFRREARALASLSHPNIATIHSFEEDGDVAFLTMEHVPGDTLEARLDRGPLPIELTLRCGVQTAAALSAAHEKGVIHRDLKPGNLKLSDEGGVKVLDFGLAKLLLPEETQPQGFASFATGPTVLGTPGYMSPEQLRAEESDGGTDLWALGCILFECLSGDRAFSGRTSADRVAATLLGDPDWDSLPARTPSGFVELVRQCLEKDRARRPESAGVLVRELGALLGQKRVESSDVRVPPSLTRVGNLPRLMTRTIGRGRAIQEVFSLLEHERLVTLIGPGGAGKTRVSVEVGSRVWEDCTTPVWFVDLAPCGRDDLVVGAVATTLGIEGVHGGPLDSIARFIGEQRVILILDNCEHLLAGCREAAASLLDSCSELRIIVTSREALGVSGEFSFPVPLLDVPSSTAELDVDAMRRIEAIDLFVDRARSVESRFEIDAQNCAAIMAICRRLDGLPLAIELAAARVRVMPVEEIARRLDDRFRLLTSRGRGALPHHRTLRALIDWSYQTLNPAEQSVLSRLSVFVGGWFLDAAEEVCSGHGVEAREVAELLFQLVEKSLVIYDAERSQTTGEARYRFLESVREFAHEMLDPEDVERLNARHRRHFMMRLEEALPHLRGSHPAPWLERLSIDHENRMAALWGTLEDLEERPRLLELRGVLEDYWSSRGHFDEGRRFFTTLLESGIADRGTRDWDRLQHSRCRLIELGGDYDQAERLLLEASEDAEARGDELVVAEFKDRLGSIANHRGEHAKSWQLHDESLAVHRAANDRRPMLSTLNSMGIAAWGLGHHENARRCFEESLEIARELGDVRMLAMILNNLGSLACHSGELARGRALFEESLPLRKRAGDRRGATVTLSNLGALTCNLGDRESSERYYQQSHALSVEMAYQRGIAIALSGLALISRLRGDHDESRRLGEEGLSIHRRIGNRVGVARELTSLARVERNAGDVAVARTLLSEALELCESLDNPQIHANCLSALGSLDLDDGLLDSAGSLFRESLEIRRDLDVDVDVTFSFVDHAALALARGNAPEAASLLGSSLVVRERCGWKQGEDDASLQAIRASVAALLSPAQFEKALLEGRVVPLNQVVERLLEGNQKTRGTSEPSPYDGTHET